MIRVHFSDHRGRAKASLYDDAHGERGMNVRAGEKGVGNS